MNEGKKVYKILLTKALDDGSLCDHYAIGEVHLTGAIDTTACGLAYEMYDYEKTSKPISCPTCKTHHLWAIRASKIKV